MMTLIACSYSAEYAAVPAGVSEKGIKLICEKIKGSQPPNPTFLPKEKCPDTKLKGAWSEQHNCKSIQPAPPKACCIEAEKGINTYTCFDKQTALIKLHFLDEVKSNQTTCFIHEFIDIEKGKKDMILDGPEGSKLRVINYANLAFYTIANTSEENQSQCVNMKEDGKKNLKEKRIAQYVVVAFAVVVFCLAFCFLFKRCYQYQAGKPPRHGPTESFDR